MPTQKYDLTVEDDLMMVALQAAEKAARLGNYFIGGALFDPNGYLIATAYGAVASAGEIYHAETQLAVLLRAGRAAELFPRDEPFTLVTTLQPCPQCRQVCIQQQRLIVIYGAKTETSGTTLGDLGVTFTNTENLRIRKNEGQPVVRQARLSAAVLQQCRDNHRRLRQPIIQQLDHVELALQPFTDLLELVEVADPSIIKRIRKQQQQARDGQQR